MKIKHKGSRPVVLAGGALLLLAGIIGFAVYNARAPQPAAPAPVPAPRIEEAPAPIGEPISRIYFEAGSATLPPKAMDELAVVLGAAAVKQGAIVLVSGFHGAAGGADNTADLARQRALAVRTALERSGLADYRIRLSRPAETTGGSPRDARRVELRVQ
ncbi:OmpA family protein [Niveibacterium sp. SC-1]|uniref:OmpA family protein n=1 Tax=Niveibacterium sp. SC-1 TaxID=3135646 RepID=UPI00311F7E84